MLRLGGAKAEEEAPKSMAGQSGEDTAEDPSAGESFQKQVQVLTMMMNAFMYEQPNPFDPLLKLEICSILNHYMDFTMDFYLNNLKIKFKEWVEKLNLYKRIEHGELDIDKAEDVEYIKGEFKKQIEASMPAILPKILPTGVSSVDDKDPTLKP